MSSVDDKTMVSRHLIQWLAPLGDGRGDEAQAFVEWFERNFMDVCDRVDEVPDFPVARRWWFAERK